MRTYVVCVFCVMALAVSGSATAQTWKGVYVGGAVGGALQSDDAAETLAFDTNLDGVFSDTVRTAAGVNAFSPGFCGGAAATALPSAGCADDEDGVDFGGRVGYDWSSGMFVVGGVAELSWADITDSVSAFSTTPAFYTQTRTMDMLASFRARAGVGGARALVYGTGGFAQGWIEQRFSTSNTVNTFVAVNQDGDGERQGASGYQFGGGVEFALGGRMRLFGEYLWTSLDNRDESTIRAQGPAPATNPFILTNASGTDLRRTERFEWQSLRAGVSYRF
jgi:outer membrane immunogenic protein